MFLWVGTAEGSYRDYSFVLGTLDYVKCTDYIWADYACFCSKYLQKNLKGDSFT